MKMLYYISEHLNHEGCSFANHLIKRCESHKEAALFLRDKRNEWANKGLQTRDLDDSGEVWGVIAMNANGGVVHNYKIFATPMFMAGGEEGL